jgi:hypothetical protein
MAEIAGLKLIVPSSVSATGAGSSASVSASGKVTFTSAETLTIEDCFVGYDNYLMVMRHVGSSSDSNITGQLRVSGTTATGNNYTRQGLAADNTSVTGSRLTNFGSANWLVYNSSSQRSGAHVYFYGPSLSQPTAMRTVQASGYSNAYIEDVAHTHSLSTAYTSLVLNCASGISTTGALTIYGLSQ